MPDLIVSVAKQEDADELERMYATQDLVRCKECKYAYMAGNLCKYCDLYKDDDGFPIELYLEADWFCAGGERKAEQDG